MRTSSEWLVAQTVPGSPSIGVNGSVPPLELVAPLLDPPLEDPPLEEPPLEDEVDPPLFVVVSSPSQATKAPREERTQARRMRVEVIGLASYPHSPYPHSHRSDDEVIGRRRRGRR
jgi:hypothetical protein